ncbi:transcription initiation factor IIA, gamma subunit-domain-containing protein [Mycena belliarum]|uniref:Transcription initiation factor IIA subunit 2 n=1 Tax=Mycena belliarum TaxID=1033014 RepID=A0AAD6TVQ5_9AGAR|nr:transcription initiation factor IIA, gamma subunit-domain-containing protein [Mycena belliae]
MSAAHSEVYRRSTLGIALLDSLDDCVRDSIIPEDLACLVLAAFDKAMAAALMARVRARATVKGHLHTYRLCEDVWSFHLTDATFKMDGRQTVSTRKIKIVAMRSIIAGEPEVKTPETSPMKRY